MEGLRYCCSLGERVLPLPTISTFLGYLLSFKHYLKGGLDLPDYDLVSFV
jgi:hypothetical protein